MFGRRHAQDTEEQAGSHSAVPTPRHAADDRDHGDHAHEHDAVQDHEETHVRSHEETGLSREELQRDRFAGTNWGAGFFGWLVAVAMTVLLAGITGAFAAAVGRESDLTTEELADNAGTTGVAAAVAVVVILALAYYTGGYVAGRMSRFDGGRQGFAVWLIGLVATLVAAAVGVIFGTEYDVLDRIDLPSLSIPRDQVTMGSVVTAGAVLLGTLLAAMAGGKVGRRYHRKVDTVA